MLLMKIGNKRKMVVRFINVADEDGEQKKDGGEIY
jgi:hypothetical protein